MSAVWAFVWDNWDWVGALTAGPFAFVARQAGRRWLMWLLIASAVLLLIRSAVGSFSDWLAARDALTVERCDAGWARRLSDERAAAAKDVSDKEDAAYLRGIDDQAKRDAADAEDAAKAETIIREIVHESPSAASCRYDDAAVAGLNRLRRGQD